MAGNVAPNTVTNGLVLYLDAGNTVSYPGTGTSWRDISGNSNNGTLTNGPTFNSNNGGSIVFDGTNDYVNNTSYTASNDYTLSLWCYYNTPTSELGNYYRTLISKGGVFINNSTFGFGFRNVTNTNVRLFLYFYNGSTEGGTEFALTTSPYQKWRNFAVSKTSNVYLFYENGTLISTYNASISPSANSYPLNMGTDSSLSSTSFFNGSIATSLIYNRGLSSTEITQNYNALKGRYGL